ncbi:VanZ family protein [soil metagenome]
MSHWLRGWGPALVCAALIFFASSRPTLPVALDSGTDKLAHFGAYAVLGFALGHARAAFGLSPAVATLIGGLYALSDEVHQSFVPGRSPDFGDWVADALGILAGLFAHHLWRHRKRPGHGGRGVAGNSAHT